MRYYLIYIDILGFEARAIEIAEIAIKKKSIVELRPEDIRVEFIDLIENKIKDLIINIGKKGIEYRSKMVTFVSMITLKNLGEIAIEKELEDEAINASYSIKKFGETLIKKRM